MCGIIGFLGNNAVNEVIGGLKTLEYRGYDSAGLAFESNGKITTIKSVGQVSELEKKVSSTKNIPTDIKLSIGHTRWATHGGVTEANCHPHVSADGSIAVVHNGIIENYKELRAELENGGVKLSSQTDTEVIPNLVAKYLKTNKDLLSAVQGAVKELAGSFAFLVMSREVPDEIIAVKKGQQPLMVGTAKEYVYITSDMPTASAKCKDIFALEDGEMAVVKRNEIKFFSNGKEIKKQKLEFSNVAYEVNKGKYATYMEKEIFEIPSVIANINANYKKIVKTEKFTDTMDKIKWCNMVHICACGTSYHAGLYIGGLLEKFHQKHTKVYFASEIKHNLPFGTPNDVVIVISQSGETADTLEALEYFKKKKMYSIGICNVEGSTISRKVDTFLPTFAGTEIAVASTKAYIAQITVGEILSGRPNFAGYLKKMAGTCIEHLGHADEIRQVAIKYRNAKRIFFLGKGTEVITALESALKVKETTYKHCEGFAAGELKHGTLALIDSETLTIAIGDNLSNAIAEVSARGSAVWQIPKIIDGMSIIYSQLFAIYTCLELGLNPDKPRNLAKSVTVG